jgi:hypothetical protein
VPHFGQNALSACNSRPHFTQKLVGNPFANTVGTRR